jgi:hypothetical protein
MVYDATQTVTTAGTRVALASARTSACWVNVQSKTGNTGAIYVGGSTIAAGRGYTLMSQGDGFLLPPVADINMYDLSTIYVDAATNGEGVNILYGRR